MIHTMYDTSTRVKIPNTGNKFVKYIAVICGRAGNFQPGLKSLSTKF